MKKRNIQALWIIGLFLLPSLSLAAIHYVDGDVVNSGDGTSWATAFKTIQEGVDASGRYDGIWVKMGTYKLSAEITVDKAVSIYGGFEGSETQLEQRNLKANVTIVDGDGIVRGFNIKGIVEIDGFTITNGKTSNNGGGIFVGQGFIVTIINCVFESNSANNGGGLFSDSSSSVTVTDSLFYHNTATIEGGGLYNDIRSYVTVTDSQFYQNIATKGGGIYNNLSMMSITNSLFYNNKTSEGGGIYNYNSSPTIMNSTFAKNIATYSGGGIYNYNYSSPNITNSIVWGNSINQIGNYNSSPSVTYSDIEGGYNGEGNIDADPLFKKAQPPGKPDFHLKAGSPAIDIGTAGGAPDTDLDGKPRPDGEGYDLGAYEYQQPVSLLQFSQADYQVTEDGSTITITVTRDGDSAGAVSVDYATSDETAVAGSDYTSVSGTLNWTNGDTKPKTFKVDIIDDDEVEEDETVILSLGNVTGGAQLGSPDTAVVTITDNEQTEKHGILQFSKTEFTVREDVHTAQAIITVQRIGGSDGIVLIEHATSDDSAKAGSDYTHTMGGVRWEDGDDDDKTFTVHIINDDEPENKETFIVSLANPIGGAQLGTPDTATVTIRDDDFNCKKVSEIPKKECQALVALYDSTSGENWTDNTGWKTTTKPCSWDGVTCRSEHVTGLSLGDNNLKGSISKKLGKLKKLKRLLLNNNKLSGNIPSSLMKLKKLEELDLNDNCLKKKVSKKLGKWLDDLNPGWDETQTNCLY
jgi:hypothetical protein